VTVSQWEAGLEPNGLRPAVRLGLNQVQGLPEAACRRIEAARRQQAFDSVHDLAVRAELNRHAVDALAAANALKPLTGHRHLARWEAASHPLHGLLNKARIPDAERPPLPAPTEGQDISADYRSMGLTLGRHPLA